MQLIMMYLTQWNNRPQFSFEQTDHRIMINNNWRGCQSLDETHGVLLLTEINPEKGMHK